VAPNPGSVRLRCSAAPGSRGCSGRRGGDPTCPLGQRERGPACQTGTYGGAKAGGFSHARASFNKAISVPLPIFLPVRLGTGQVEEHKGPQTIGRAGAFLTPAAAGEELCLQRLPSSPAPLFRRCLPGVRRAGERGRGLAACCGRCILMGFSSLVLGLVRETPPSWGRWMLPGRESERGESYCPPGLGPRRLPPSPRAPCAFAPTSFPPPVPDDARWDGPMPTHRVRPCGRERAGEQAGSQPTASKRKSNRCVQAGCENAFPRCLRGVRNQTQKSLWCSSFFFLMAAVDFTLDFMIYNF